MTHKFPSEKDAKNAVKVWDLAKSIRVAMATRQATSVEESPLESRPMESLFDQHDSAIWFVVKRPTADDWAGAQRQTILTYSNGGDGDHVVLNGTMNTVNDKAKLKALWDGHADIRFPKGPSDPAAALLRFDPSTAAFWSGGGDIFSFVVHFIEAKLTDRRPAVGVHGAVAL